MNGKIVTAGELRIGNILALPKENIKVFSIVHEIREGWLINGIPLEILQPIPLSGELLEKCRFEKNKKYEMRNSEVVGYTKNGFILWCSIDEPYYWINVDSANEDKSHIQPDIKYLHQLQNLFYCLTGEELEVKM